MDQDFAKRSSSALDNAEDLVSENLSKFESAMEHLTERMEESSKRIEHLAELASKQKDEILKMRDKVKNVFEPVAPYFKDTASKVKSNPSTAVWAAVCLIGGYFLINRLGKRGGFSSAGLSSERNSVPANVGMAH